MTPIITSDGESASSLAGSKNSIVDIEDLLGPFHRLLQSKDTIDEAQALLRRVQGELRVDPGINAFLVLDVNVDVDGVDAAAQSIEYTRCRYATAFLLPFLGRNFGVGEEAGSVLERFQSHMAIG